MDKDIWNKELGHFAGGSYSFASVKGNIGADTFSRVEIGRRSIFLGIYDGHGQCNSDASKFVDQNLFDKIIEDIKRENFFTEYTLSLCLNRLESDYMNRVRAQMHQSPDITASGASCLVAVVIGDTLYLGSLGDCVAIMGVEERGSFRGNLLTPVENVNVMTERNKYLEDHGLNAICEVDGVYKIKDNLEVTNSIGDACYKFPECAAVA
ncbi:hypothetical protein PIB30_105284, partial [Stylosanthes scabra]|nr:hypothetical protein [Stylosanthes scabra]